MIYFDHLAESTTNSPAVDVEEATTVIPPQQPVHEANSPSPPTVAEAAEPAAAAEAAAPAVEVGSAAAVNESIVNVAAEVADDFGHTSFVSLGDEGLEQGIRNAVKSEVESEIEADSLPVVGEKIHAESEQKPEEIHVEPTGKWPLDDLVKQFLMEIPSADAAQGVREPKTLATDEEEVKPVEEESQSPVDSAVTHEKQPQHEERPLPSLTSDLVAVILDENRAITEQPITNTNLLALEQEHQQLNVAETTPKPNFEEPKHQVTKKQGVEDLLPIEQVEKKEEVEAEPEPVPPTVEVAAEQAPEPAAEVAAEPAVKAEAQPAVEANVEAAVAPAVEPEVEPVVEPVAEVAAETSPEAAAEISPEAASAVVPVAEAEVKPASEVEPTPAPEPERETENKEDQPNLDIVSENKKEEPSSHLNEIEENVIESDEKDKEPVQPVEEEQQQKQGESTEASVKVAAEPVPASASSESVEDSLTPTKETEVKPEVNQEESVVEGEIAAASSTEAPAVPEVAKVDLSVVDKSNDYSSAESGETGTELPAVQAVADKESSEESEELSADEAKARAEDSTATPLVSYPPHNAGQTFDSNLADESSAYHSLDNKNRSTLIIALCSGTAVVFIITSLVIFLLSFQRQHGTLDIEMQEQRLGKDNLDEEDAQLKLLDVDLSAPVVIAMGNEETDECL